MTVTTYTSNGTPSDNTGVQGDMNIDYVGRLLWGPKGATSWAGTASSIVGPTGPASPAGLSKSYVPMGSHYRATNQSGIVRSIEIFASGTGTSTLGQTPLCVPFISSGYVVGLSMIVTYAASTLPAISLQVYKNNLTGITGQIIDVAAISSGGSAGSVPASPITFAPNTYTFAAGDYLGMGVNSGSVAFTCAVGMFVVYTS